MFARLDLRRLGWALVVIWVVLIVTGVIQSFVYKPNPNVLNASAAYLDMESISGWRFSRFVGRVHLVAAALAVLVPFIATFFAIAGQRVREWALAAIVFLLTIATVITGLFLPWDQLALREVSVGTDIKGYAPIFGDNVRFALVDGAEVSTSSLRVTYLLHAIALPVVTATVVTTGVRWLQRHRRGGSVAPRDPGSTP